MPESTEKSPPCRQPWKLWHMMLLPLPGLVFMIAYPLVYASRLHAARESYSWTTPTPEIAAGKWSWKPLTCAGEAAVPSAALALGVLLVVAVVFVRAWRRKKTSAAENTVLPAIMFILNIILVFGGCSLGDFATRDLRVPPPESHPAPANPGP